MKLIETKFQRFFVFSICILFIAFDEIREKLCFFMYHVRIVFDTHGNVPNLIVTALVAAKQMCKHVSGIEYSTFYVRKKPFCSCEKN